MTTTLDDPAQKLDSTETVAARDESEPGLEFDGVNWVEKTAANKSSAVAATAIRLLGNNVVETSAGVVFGSDQAYRCYADNPAKFRKSDVSFVRADRLPADWEDQAVMPIPADLAVEVISPSDLYYDVEAKVEEYLAAGFGTVWIVNPLHKNVRTYGGGRRPATFYADDEITGEPFLPTFRCKVAALFE